MCSTSLMSTCSHPVVRDRSIAQGSCSTKSSSAPADSAVEFVDGPGFLDPFVYKGVRRTKYEQPGSGGGCPRARGTQGRARVCDEIGKPDRRWAIRLQRIKLQRTKSRIAFEPAQERLDPFPVPPPPRAAYRQSSRCCPRCRPRRRCGGLASCRGRSETRPVSLAMAVLETPSSRKRRISSSLPSSRETPSEPLRAPELPARGPGPGRARIPGGVRRSRSTRCRCSSWDDF